LAAFAAVDLEVVRVTTTTVTAVALVADQRLVPTVELLSQRCLDRCGFEGEG
jgi:hypothetical protein